MASVCIDDNNLWFVSIQNWSIHINSLFIFVTTYLTDKSYPKTISFKYWFQNAVTIMKTESSWCAHVYSILILIFCSHLLQYRDYIKKEKPSLKMFEGVVVLSFLFILRLPFWLLPKTPVGLKIMTKNIGHHSRQYNRAIIELKSMNYYCMLITTFLKVDWISEVQTWDICVGCALRVNIIMWIRVGTM